MKVSAAQPFQIIYSLYQHEYLGYIFESFIVHLDDRGKLTYQHQSISTKNAREFSKGLDNRDYELIELMDKMNQEVILKKFSTKPMKPGEFFAKVYDKQKGNELVKEEIEHYLEGKRAEILEKMKGKQLYEMGNDGEPTWKKVEILERRASIQFHFARTAENTNYFPTITYDGRKVDIPNPAAYLICKEPAWMVLSGKLYGFDKPVDGKKLLPFLNKKFVVIPKNLEETYYNRFVAPLIASFDDIDVQGFEINKSAYDPLPLLTMSELHPGTAKEVPTLFEGGEGDVGAGQDDAGKIAFDLSFKYGKHRFRGESFGSVSVTIEKRDREILTLKRSTRKR
jgi:hypothetical protein